MKVKVEPLATAHVLSQIHKADDIQFPDVVQNVFGRRSLKSFNCEIA
jgi:hypothetical protein